MDDGGRCLLDVINDPQLLQSFLESDKTDSEGISKDRPHHRHQQQQQYHPGGSMTVASNTVLIGCEHHVTASGHQLSSNASLFSASGLKPTVESMGFNCQATDKQNLMGHITLSASHNNSALGVSVVSPVVTSSVHLHTLSPSTFVNSVVRHGLAPNTPRTANTSHNSHHHHHHHHNTPTTVHFNSSKLVAPHQQGGSISVHSMPPPSSPLQPIRSPHPPHTHSPVPQVQWSPSPNNNAPMHGAVVRAPALTPTSNINHVGGTQVVHTTTSVISPSGQCGNVIIPTSVAQKLQQQQVVYHHAQSTLVPLSHQQHSGGSHHPQTNHLPQVVTTTSSVTSPVVQFISASHQNANVPLQTTNSARSTSHHVANTRNIQPKQPQQILPKPPNSNVTPVKQVAAAAPPPQPPRTATVGVGINPTPGGNHHPMMISQNAPSVFTGPQGTIVFNHMLPNMGQTPLLIQGNLGNLQGMQFTLRPPHPTTFTTGGPNATHLQHNGAQNNAALIAALQASSQQSQGINLGGGKPQQLQGQHTIMIPSNLAASGLTGQNLNLSASGQVLQQHPQGLITSRPNFILAPRMLGPHQGFHLHQIQTPNGPMTIALAPGQALSLPQVQNALQNSHLANASLGQGQVAMQNHVATGQGFFPGISLQPQTTHQTLHTQPVFNPQQNLIAAPVVTFQKAQEQQAMINIQQQQQQQQQQSSGQPIRRTSTPITTQQNAPISVPSPHQQLHPTPPPHQQQQHNTVEQQEHQSDGELCMNNGSHSMSSVVSTPEPVKPTKPQGLNLAELLKEHGIMPESTPPPSPGTNTNSQNSAFEHQQAEFESNKTAINEAQQQQNPITLAMNMNHPTVMQLLQANESGHPQLKLSMTQDGSLILQPPMASLNVPHQSSLPPKVSLAECRSQPQLPPSVPLPVKAPDPLPHVSPHSHPPHRHPAPKVSKSHAALLARLNSGPAISVPTIKTHTSDSVISESKVGLLESLNKGNNATPTFCTSSAASVIPVAMQTVTTAAIGGNGNRMAPHLNNPNSLATVSRHPLTTPAVQNHNSSSVPSFPIVSNSVNSKATTTYNCFNHVILGLQPVCNPNSQNISLAVASTTSTNTCLTTSNRNIASANFRTSATVCSTAAVSPQLIHSNNNVITTMANSMVNVNTTNMVGVPKMTDVSPVPSGLTEHQQRTLESTIQVQRRLESNQFASNSHLNNKQISMQQPVLPKPPIVIPKLSQQPVQKFESHPSGSNTPANPPVINLQVLNGNSVCSTLSRSTMFRHQLIADQDAAVKAFTRKPFLSREEACRRLLSFHVYHTPKTTDDDFKKADELFEMLSQHLLDKRQKIYDKFQTLMLKESLNEYPSSERFLVERLFVEGESSSLALEKRLASELKEPSVPLTETLVATPALKSVSLQDSADCDETLERHSTDHKQLRAELKTLQLRLHRSLKRDRASSPSEEDFNTDHNSSKRSTPNNKLIIKNTKLERRSPTSEIASSFGGSQLDESGALVALGAHHHTSVGAPRSFAKINDCKIVRSDNHNHHHHRDLLRPIDNPNNNALSLNSCHLEEDLMSKIRKELNLSPIDHEDHEPSSVHHDDFESATAASGLADFELPVARTDQSSNPPSVLSFAGESRLRNEVNNYDFGVMDSSSEWTEAYAEQDKKLFLESEAAVESILNSDEEDGATPELGLSDIEDLDEELVRAAHSFRRGAKEAIAAAEHSLSNSKLGRLSHSLLGNGDNMVDPGADGSVSSLLHNDPPELILNTQVQSAIKSILNFQSVNENRSFSTTSEGDQELVSQVLNFNRRITREMPEPEAETSEQGPFSMENVSIDYGDYNDDDEEEDDEDEEDEDEDQDEDDEEEDEEEERACSSGAGANGSVESAYAEDGDGSNPESDAALDEAVRSILL